jgi:hypothetical protein
MHVKEEVPAKRKREKESSSGSDSSTDDSDDSDSSSSSSEDEHEKETESKYEIRRPRALYDSLAFPSVEGARETVGDLLRERKPDGGGPGKGLVRVIGIEGGEAWKRETETEVILLARTCEGTQVKCSVQDDGKALALSFSSPPLPVAVRTLLRLPDDADDSALRLPLRRITLPLDHGQAAGDVLVTDAPGVKVITVKKRL